MRFVVCLLQACLLGAFHTSAGASEIDGTVVIKRKLTRSKVTASASAYQRGVAVDLAKSTPTEGVDAEYQRVVVYLEGSVSAAAGGTEPVTAVMEQKNRQFVQDTLVIRAGSSVSFPNLDPIFHNVFSLSKAKTFDLGNYPKGQTRIVTFPKPGVVFVNCQLHPNMSAAIVVTPNDWSARVDDKGKFRLPRVPAGNYTVVAWHKTAGFFRQQVKIRENDSVAVTFLIPIDENGKAIAGQKTTAHNVAQTGAVLPGSDLAPK